MLFLVKIVTETKQHVIGLDVASTAQLGAVVEVGTRAGLVEVLACTRHEHPELEFLKTQDAVEELVQFFDI